MSLCSIVDETQLIQMFDITNYFLQKTRLKNAILMLAWRRYEVNSSR